MKQTKQQRIEHNLESAAAFVEQANRANSLYAQSANALTQANKTLHPNRVNDGLYNEASK